MLNSVLNDIKQTFRSGNMITRLIIINVAVYIVMALLQAFTPGGSGFFTSLTHYLAIPGEPLTLLTRPWTLFTSMFLHIGFWHMAINMLYLYWFGRITGDLIGDRHVLPIYILGGLVGALAYFLSYQLLGSGIIGSYALGASAAVMALVIVAGLVAPEYNMRLLLIGNVKLKYIVLAIIFFDLIGVANSSNTGGHIAHLGGMLMGYIYITQLRNGRDLSSWFTAIGNKFRGIPVSAKEDKKSPIRVVHKVSTSSIRGKKKTSTLSTEEQVDIILDKIKEKGYDSLSDEEKEVLYKASKS